MREAVKSIITPQPLQETIEILKNKKAQQKRVESKNGEVLTTEDVKKGLRLEEIERKAKTKAKKKKKKKEAKNQHEHLEISLDDDSDQPIACQLDVDDTDTPDGGPFSLLNLWQSLEDIQKYLTNVWEWLSPPVIKKDKTGSWYAVIFEDKQRTQLNVGKLTQQFLLDENGTVESTELEELKPKSGGGTDLEQPSIGSWACGIYKLEDVIAGPLELIPRKMAIRWNCILAFWDYAMLAKLNRQQFL